MISVLFAFILVLQLPGAHSPAAGADVSVPAQAAPAQGEDLSTKLVKVKRIFVDNFGDDPTSQQCQSMLVSAFTESKRFIVTENKEKADAIVRGTALEKTTKDFHSTNDKTLAGGRRAVAATDDSSAYTETVDHARLAVRLVSPDGDVMWATTQESTGAKYKGASADVADKVLKQLLRDIAKLEKPTAEPTASVK